MKDFDYSAWDASMCVNLLMPEGKNIIRMSYDFSFGNWEHVVIGVESGVMAIGKCCWLTSPSTREEYYKENLKGIQ